MKNKVLVILFATLIIGSGIFFYHYSNAAASISNSTDSPYYKDGVYHGYSRSIYLYENFWGKVQLTIKNGKITNVEFQIVDQDKNEVFSENYERHYAGNDYYIEQCRKDWKGIQTYPQLLLQKQNINDIDAVTGATWSFNIFKDSVAIALREAKDNIGNTK